MTSARTTASTDYILTGFGFPAPVISSSTSTCSGVSASVSVSLFRCARILSTSSAPSHFEITTVATPLPIKLVSARGFGHEAVDTRNQCNGGNGDRADSSERRGKDNKARASHASSALRCQ